MEMECDKCGDAIPDVVVRSCWEDVHTPDHKGLCCSCFDVALGKHPPVVLGLRSVARIDFDNDDDL